jgi:NTP pyrophosphatase (non-canonical NTP hydrolase)
MTLELNEYQRIARATAIYQDPIVYPALGLSGESGEVAEKIKKLIRDKGGIMGLQLMAEEDRVAVAKEIGDVLWYCANLAQDIGYSLEDVARINIGKLAKRKEDGTLSGSGDNR